MTFILLIATGVFCRFIIHIPDVTPLTALCLLAPTLFSKRLAFLMIFLILILSDFLLHFTQHIPILGSWTLFTYSGWFLIVLLGILLKGNFSVIRSICFSVLASGLFWVWSNFGTWACGAMYAHTSTGLISCYVAALPFLRNSVLGAVAWMAVLMLPFVFGEASYGMRCTQKLGRKSERINLLRCALLPLW